MAESKQERRVADRRRQPRGGRRRADREGFAPLVFVVDDDARRRDISEAILAKLRFAVAPFESVDKAISVMQALRPAVVVARADLVDRLRASLPRDAQNRSIPLVPIPDDLQSAEPLVEAVRQVLRERRETR
jgi:DNA-binding NtrC family response regulator